MKPLRVTHIIGQLDTGGAERLLVEMAKVSPEKGIVPSFVSLTTKGEQGAILEGMGYRVITLDKKKGLRPSLIPRIAAALRELKPDVVHTHSKVALIYGAPAARLAKIPALIHTVHGQGFGYLPRQNFLTTNISRLTDYVVCVSKDARQLCEKLGYPAEKLRVVSNGVSPTPSSHGKREEGLLVTVGRLTEEKDIPTLLKAIEIVRKTHRGVRLLIAGEGRCRGPLEKLTQELGLSDSVTFLGASKEIPALLGRAAIFVLASKSEGLPMAILEAMSAGVPVISTQVGGIPEVIQDGVNGVLISPGNPGVLAGKIRQLLENAPQRADIAKRAETVFQARFHIRNTLESYIQLYRTALSQREDAKEMRERGMTRVVRRAVIHFFETRVKRRPIFKILRQLDETQWASPRELEEIRVRALHELLAEAKKNCPYFESKWKSLGLDPDRIRTLKDFTKWPITTREEIGQHGPAMKNRAISKGLIKKSTGGSTGRPLHFYLTEESYSRRNAATMRGYGWAGNLIGSSTFYLWSSSLTGLSRLGKVKEWIYLKLYGRDQFNIFNLHHESLPVIYRRLCRSGADVIVSYAQTMYLLARYMLDHDLPPPPLKTAIVGAEKIHPYQRQAIEKALRAPLFDTYGSREFMLMGAECERHEGFHLTAENLIVEVVDGQGNPVPEGVEGSLVVTDLYNYGMPFIRYANGDRGILGTRPCTCGRGLPLLREVTGREADVITTPDGRFLPGIFFPHLFKDFPAILQFQVVQDAADHLEIRLVPTKEFNSTIEARVTELLKAHLGSSMRFEIRLSQRLEVTAAGKTRPVIKLQASESPLKKTG